MHNPLCSAWTLSAALALAPCPATQDVYFPAGEDRVVVPFRLLENGADASAVVVVSVRIGEAEVDMLLDTGASIHVLSESLVERLELQAGYEMFAVGMSDTQKARRYRIPLLRVGDLKIENTMGIQLAAREFVRALDRMHGVEIEGVLGEGLFSAGPVTLDFDTEQLTVHRPGSFTPPEGATVLRLDSMLGIPVIKASIGGRRPARFLVDTGHANAVVVNGPYAVRYGLLERKARLASVEVSGVFGRAQGFRGLLPELAFGDLVLLDLPATVIGPDADGGLVGDAVRAGNIGLAVWSRYRVTLDYRGRRLYLEPRAGIPSRFPSDFGLQLRIRQGSVAVAHVATGSPAESAGLQRFDRLVKLDGRPVPDTVTETIRLLRRAAKVEIEYERHSKGRGKVRLENRSYLPLIEDPR